MPGIQDSLQVPTLLLDEARCRANIARMAEKARRHRIQFRPHAKTHQSREIARWMRDYGVEALTVSSLRMADYFADDGWNDITVAFPANLREAGRIQELASRIRLNLLAESLETLQHLDDLLESPAGIFIKADTGYGRTGLKPGQWDILDPMVEFLDGSKMLAFKGFLCHAGQSYAERDREGLERVHRASVLAMTRFRTRYLDPDRPLIMSIGDTPTCSVIEDFEGIDEMRPGNFIFYDLDQLRIGSCQAEDIAVALACPVVALHPDRAEAVLYGGGVHLSTERQLREDGVLHFGYLANWQDRGWNLGPNPPYLRKISQEHGIACFPDRKAFERIRIGDMVPVLPVHSCMTADIMKGYLTLEGQGIDMMHYYS